MIGFLIYLLVLCIVFGALYYVITLLPLPAPFPNIALVLLILIFVLLLLATLTGAVSMPKFVVVP